MHRSHLMAALAVVFLADSLVCLADEPPTDDPAAPLIFTSFRGNGEDGLHLAWS